MSDRKPRAKPSPLWQYFDAVDSNYANCKTCNCTVSYRTSSSNLKKHMRRRHPNIHVPSRQIENINRRTLKHESEHCEALIDAVASIVEVAPSTDESPTTSYIIPHVIEYELLQQVETSYSPMSVQTEMSAYIPKMISERSQKDIDEKLLQLFTMDFQPFSIVNDQGFKEFIYELNPSYDLPSEMKISKIIIPAKYEELKLKLKKNLDQAKSFSATAKCWISSNNESFLAITAHYIYKERLVNVLLDCRLLEKCHTSEYVAENVKEILDEWGISQKVICMISDNAKSVMNAITSLNLKHIACAVHKLNLIVNSAFKEASISLVIDKTKRILNYFCCSTTAHNQLIDCQRKKGVTTPKKLINSAMNNWNSIFFTLQQFIELKVHIKDVAAVDKELLGLSPTEWKIAENLFTTLEHLDKTMCTLTSQQFPTASVLIIIVNGLLDVFDRLLTEPEFADFHVSIKSLITTLIKEIKRPERFGCLEQHDLLSQCTLLDPRFKDIGFKDPKCAEGAKEVIKYLLVARIEKSLRDYSLRHQEESQMVAEMGENKLSIWSHIQATLSAGSKNQGTAETKAMIELERYFDEVVIGLEGNPLMWWESNRYNYPLLSEIASERLCIVAATGYNFSPCEQLLSRANVNDERQNLIFSDDMKMLLFLNWNEKLKLD